MLRSIAQRILKRALIKFAEFYKPIHMETQYAYGDVNRLHLGKNVSTMNTVFNLVSGHVRIGNDTIFGHNCMVLTGRHEFVRGRRKRLVLGEDEAPRSGYDISIGEGCWIASGSIILGGVTIGDNVIIGAGAVVTADMPSGVFAAGVPARVVRSIGTLDEGGVE